MGDFRNQDCCCEPCEPCCEPAPQCCCVPPQNNCCNNDSGNGLGILILLVVLYFLFCGNDGNRGGGLFGGLF
ncbi:hypothetical protein AALA24_04745 [Anaerovoracaceae bacterium 42-11]|nr:hypothetical protein [Emergencia sp.]